MMRRIDKDQNTNRKDGETRSIMHQFEVVVKNLEHFYRIVHYLNTSLGRKGWHGQRKTVAKFRKGWKQIPRTFHTIDPQSEVIIKLL